MGQIYKFLGMTVGVIVHGLDDEERRAGLRRRHHLRHQQRVRLRLSARQHEIRHGADGPARPCLRHRRRGRLDPGRRGAHAAHHFRPVGGPLRPLRRRRHDHSRTRARGLSRSTRSSARSISPKPATNTPRRLLRATGVMKEGSLYEACQRDARPSRQSGAARAQALPARQGLYRPQRRGRDRRRVHRPHDAGPALFGGPASGARGQGARRPSSPRT